MAESKQKSRIQGEVSNSFSLETVCKSSNFIKNLREIIETHPDDGAKNLGLSIIHLLYGNYDKVLNCLDIIASQHPDIPLIQRRIAEIYIYRNNFQAAIPYLEKVLELNEEDMTAQIWLNLSYFVTGETKKARANLKLLKSFVFSLNAKESNWSKNEN